MSPSYITPMERRVRVRNELFHAEQEAADMRSTTSSFEIDPVYVTRRDVNKAPSSTYLGKVYFFDSVEHRNMFEANSHQPVAMAPGVVSAPQ